MTKRGPGDHILDLYWSGPERRISGLTLRIIGVNAIALIILAFGTVYLGDYQKTLVAAKLEAFQSDAELVAAGISGTLKSESLDEQSALSITKSLLATRSFRMFYGGEKRALLFDAQGRILSDSRHVDPTSEIVLPEPKPELESIRILKKMAGFILQLIPSGEPLPHYPAIPEEAQASAYPNASEALAGKISLSAWLEEDGLVFLSASAPIRRDGKILGALLMTREARDIQEEVTRLWANILRIFIGTLLITVMLSIYLSGTIAAPLRKLARAADSMRAGHSRGSDIPDFSERHDEIGELSVVLRNMTESLWSRMDRIERFAAEVAHELKNPLTSLKSAAETAGRVKKKEDLDKLLSIIVHDADRMSRLISDISAASRLDTELSREALTAVDMNQLAHTLLDSYEPGLERKAVDPKIPGRIVKAGTIILRYTVEGNGAYKVAGIESRLLQVLDNLLSNAISFSPPKGSIAIRLATEERHIILQVEDQGPGIPSGKLEAIFERFYSERPQHEDFGNHSGLGLAICHQIVEAHGGKIYAENIIDNKEKVKGARFTVVLNRL
ncbi:MAG: sensor N-terminal transmembrane domain-containing protein [Alphaproteobacteria bacterium]|nr:sensor N-terminal transmembrane domain-containing protein [Alphaproteobacteria bacterium]